MVCVPETCNPNQFGWWTMIRGKCGKESSSCQSIRPCLAKSDEAENQRDEAQNVTGSPLQPARTDISPGEQLTGITED